MNCPACGADNREGAHFCRRCGGELAEAPPGELPVQAGEVGNGSQPEPGAISEEAPPEAEVVEEPAGDVVIADQALETTAAEAEGRAEGDALLGTDQGEEPEDAGPVPEPEGEVLAFWREEVEPLTPAGVGLVLDGRYEIVEVLDVQEDEILYLARDLQCCWQCGFEGNAATDGFCARCGASLEQRPEVRLLEVRQAEVEPGSELPAAARLAYEGRTFLLLVEPEEQVEAAVQPEGLRLLIGQRSDPGQVRDLNEDSLLAFVLTPTYVSQVGPLQALFAVADGMGGHEGGEVASKMALQVMVDRVMRTLVLPGLEGQMVPEEEIAVRLSQAIMAANDTVYLARQKAANDMGTTLTAAYVRDRQLSLAHVGDCRLYRWNADGLQQLTVDHSVVASMVASGQAVPEDVYTHPHRSIIYRCIGDKPMIEVDTDQLLLSPGDRLLLCSDGLWEMLRSEGIEDVMLQEADPQAACETLVSRANTAGGDDNISVIVVQVDGI